MIAFLLSLWLASTPSFAVSIVHTNDVMGELEPCGCRSNPLGGITRKANLLKKLQDQNFLQLDAGDLLFSMDRVPELLGKQSETQASFLLKAHELLGHDAIVPGEKDFALGYSAFTELVKNSKIRFLAANLKKKNGGKFLEPHAIFTRKDETGKSIKIGVIGLVGNDLLWPVELKATPVISSARNEVRALRKKVDLLIALTHQGYEKDLELAKAVPGIDMIIGGHTQTFLQKPVQEGSTWIYQSSFRNQYVGIIPLATRNEPETYKLHALDAGYNSPAETQTPMDELVKNFKSAIAEVNSHEESQRLAQHAANSANDPNQPKFQTFSRCAECHLKQFDFWRKTQHANAFHPLMEKAQNMNKDCLSCHTVGLGDNKGFQDVGHLIEISTLSHSSDTPNPASTFLKHEEVDLLLQEIHRARDLKTKIKIPGQTESLPLRRAVATLQHSWVTVQCENCHGPGQDHPFGASISKKVENATCLKCHTADKAPEWYIGTTGQPNWQKIESKRKLVTCPAGELTEEENAD